MSGFVNPKASYQFDISAEPSGPVIYREIDKRYESYFEFHIYTTNGVSVTDKTIMNKRCIDLILEHGGEIREDWRASTGLVLYTMPYGAPNPVRETDPMFRGKMVTRAWNPYTKKEREIFGLDKQ